MNEPLPIPGNRDENWRYAALRSISKTDWSQPAPVAHAADRARIEAALPARLPHSLRLVLFAGRLITELSDPLDADSLAAQGLLLERLAGTTTTAEEIDHIDQRFAAINRRYAAEILLLNVTQPGQRVVLDILCFNSGVAQPALHITLRDDTCAEITERQLNLGEEAGTTNLRLEVQLGKNAQLDYARLIQAAARSHHLETLHCQLADRAQLHCTQVTLGGGSSRSSVFIDHGSESHVEWNATALAEGQQVHDSYVLTRHAASGATSRQLFRGIASDRARVAFNGHMQVSESALRSDLQQSLKCLLDGSSAEANLRPQLEIYTDAVTASHGATVGKLDRDMLFYLLSRGLDPETAESLLKWAFISDVLSKLPRGLRQQIERALLERLPGAIAAGGPEGAT